MFVLDSLFAFVIRLTFSTSTSASVSVSFYFIRLLWDQYTSLALAVTFSLVFFSATRSYFSIVWFSLFAMHLWLHFENITIPKFSNNFLSHRIHFKRAQKLEIKLSINRNNIFESNDAYNDQKQQQPIVNSDYLIKHIKITHRWK